MISTNDSTQINGNNDLVSEDLTTAIQKAIEPIMVQCYRKAETFLAIGVEHGERLMFQINVHASEIPILLRSRSVDADKNDPQSGKNRPVNQKHVDNIRDYIIERASTNQKWILGGITANVNPERIEYQHIWGDLYVVTIPRNTALEITDGQHRKKALAQLIEAEGPEREYVSNCTFPVILVLEKSLEQCQTDFRDMAQTYPIVESLLVAYGNYGRDAIAKELVKKVGMFKDKTQMIKKTAGSRTKYIYTINYIAKMVSSAIKNDSSNQLSQWNDKQKIIRDSEVLADALNIFFQECSDTSSIASVESITTKEATNFKEKSVLSTSVGLEVLGKLLFHTLLDSEELVFDYSKVQQLAGQLRWSKSDDPWKGTIVSKSNKMVTGYSSVKQAVEEAKNILGWT